MDRSTPDWILPLLRKFLDGNLTADESRQLDEWATASAENRQLLHRISDPEQLQQDLRMLQQSRDNGYARLLAAIPELRGSEEKKQLVHPVHRIHFLRRGFLRYAAAVLVVAGVAGWIYFSTKQSSAPAEIVTAKNSGEILPGSNRALLTLADGSVIELDSSLNGTIAQQGNTAIEKLSNGEIRYRSNGDTTASMSNTMRTPKGGQFQLTLPDGTRVWLNAASSLTYPVAFSTQERKVRITGEAYFDIAKAPAHPFIVDIDGRSTVQVLGTQFNVNAYTDESVIATTLIAGSVQVQAAQQKAILQPGQQSSISGNQQIDINTNADVERAIAWKNGKFDFNGLELPAIIRQLERWYDIRTEYAGPISKETYRGRLTRDLTLSQVLNILSNMDVKYRLEGRKLILL